MKSIRENEDETYNIAGKIYVEGRVEMIPAESSTKESLFAEMVKDLERKEDRDKYPDNVFWFKDGKFMFEYNEKLGYFWCSYARVWSVFETKLNMNYDDIQAFTKGMVEEHFKVKGVTTHCKYYNSYKKVEDHFKVKGVTTVKN